MRTIEEVIKMIYRRYRNRHNQIKPPCPDAETLVCFSEGRLSKDESKKIQEHLVFCHRCAEAVSLFCQRLEEEIAVPESLLQKAKDLVRQGPRANILEVILSLKEKVLRIIGATGDVILDNEIIPVSVFRSRKISELLQEIKLIKEFDDIKITLHIQKRDADEVKVNVYPADKASLSPLRDLRLVLLKDNLELESYESVSGNVAFDKVKPGSYVIRIMRGENKLGEIKLEIK